jgi:LysR family cys regulon transcriptional activator
MKLQQLRSLAAVAQNGLNITAAAEKLRTSQPAISKQLKLLEEELGFDIFIRSGRTLTKMTAAGEHVVSRALRILRETKNIKGISAELRDEDKGTLSIGTTHAQARYVLPAIIQRFRARYPHVQLHLHQGTSEQIAEMARVDRIDFAIATGYEQLFPAHVLLPCYQWYRRIVAPIDHPLTRIAKPTLQQLAAYPIVTYVFSFNGSSSLHEAFGRAGIKAQFALTARDADVIKTYVRMGMGVGIVASMALDPKEDRDLVSIDASHLFPIHTTWIGFPRDALLRSFMHQFIQLLAPHLDRKLVERAASTTSQEEVDALFAAMELPVR